MEEVYDKGDRYSAIDKQKEFISNDRFQVEGKGVKPRNVVNTSSKLMFTNHINALPLDENQRRYLVVSTQAENHLDMSRVYGTVKEREKFFANVYRAVENHGPAIKRWFMDWEISPAFNHKGHAPLDTRAFREMREASTDGAAEFISGLINGGSTLGVHPDILFSPSLNDAFMEADGIDLPKTSRLKNLLMEIGYTPAGVLCFNGRSGRVFVRKRVRNALREDGSLNSKWAQLVLKNHNSEVEKRNSDQIGDDQGVWEDEEV